jgi:hypothetical protein
MREFGVLVLVGSEKEKPFTCHLKRELQTIMPFTLDQESRLSGGD